MIKKEENEKQMIFTTKLVDDATNKINDGIVVKRYQNPWLKNEVGLRRSGVTFKMTKEEQEEYIKCAIDVHHFVETYCKVKREDGSVGNILLRDYQKEILDNFVNSRFNILMASRQVGKCNQLITKVLCEIINDDGVAEEVNMPMYRLLFLFKTDKTVYDYLKFSIYKIIDILS